MRFSLFSFALLFSSVAIAQQSRSVDIELKLLTPANGQVITPNVPFEFKVQAKNISGEMLLPTDTIKVRWYLGGFTMHFYNGSVSDTFLRFGGNQLAPGDSILLFKQDIGFAQVSGPEDCCFEASLVSAASTTGITDPNAANNRTCSRITVKTVGIAAVSPAADAFEVYPVPARGILNWKPGRFEPRHIALYNLTGACVQQEAVNPTSSAIAVSSLPAGIYQLLATDKAGVVIRRQIVVE